MAATYPTPAQAECNCSSSDVHAATCWARPLPVFRFETREYKRGHESMAAWYARIDRENAKHPPLRFRATLKSQDNVQALRFLSAYLAADPDYALKVVRSSADWARSVRYSINAAYSKELGERFNWTIQNVMDWLREGMTPKEAAAKLAQYAPSAESTSTIPAAA